MREAPFVAMPLADPRTGEAAELALVRSSLILLIAEEWDPVNAGAEVDPPAV